MEEIINRMARFINTFDIDEQICKCNHIGEDCELNDNDCIECIINHFRNAEEMK